MTFDGTVNVNFNEVHDGIANGPAPLTTGRHNGQLNGLHLDPGPEPIAVCGIGLRLPGGIRTGDDFWDVLYNGRDLRGPIPADRFNIDAFDDSLGKTGAIKTRYGYFLDEDLGVLDTSFFHISESELKKTDPQQRKVLEVARECFENAGEINWRAKPIGVYVGTFGDDWLQSLTRENQFKGGYNFTADLMIANKISYEFDLQGPSLVIKTGCSASLVSLHEACGALHRGDCCAALVCGTSLLIGPHVFTVMTDEGILSPDGSCKTFDASADGFARADGINAVFLKRLPDAIRDGNPIRAIIRNSGCNSDGKSEGLLSPRSSAQEALIRSVYAAAHLDPAETGFMECHGTGTATGDPVEATAVGNVFGEKGIYIGSVKPNVGHSEGASGLTSLIKAILALEHKIIPPNIKFSQPNPKIPFEEKKLVVPIVPTPWPKDRAERVSVSSYGIGGSNAHVIVDSAEHFFTNRPYLDFSPHLTPDAPALTATRLLLFSANTADSVKRFAQKCMGYSQRRPENLVNLAYTLACRREKLRHRSFALVSASGVIVTEPAPVVKKPSQEKPLVMVFSGQGAQWPQMARELILSHPLFSQIVNEMDEMLQSLAEAPEWSLKDELLKPKDSSRVHQAELSQPLTTAVQIGLVNLLWRLGMTPQAVIGHSSGEIAAAYAAGHLSMREALIISYFRGLATKFQANKGGMAAVGLSASAVKPYLLDGVVIAAENSPSATTISGQVETLDQILDKLKTDHPDTLARRLHVDMAYHSPHMGVVAERYMEKLISELGSTSQLSCPSKTTMFSTVTTQPVIHPLDLTYWVKNLTSPVKFGPGFSTMLASLCAPPLCVEIGPHSQMTGPVSQICAKEGIQSTYTPTMVRSADCIESLLSAFGQLFQQGIELDLSADSTLFPPGETLIDLPSYEWDHSVRYWHENRVSHDWRFRKYGHHALLGERIPESSTLEPAWRCVLELDDEPWLRDHVVAKSTVFPFAGYVSMAGEAIRQVTGIETGFRAKHVVVHAALVLVENKPVELMTTLRRRKLTIESDSDYFDFVISSLSGHAWTKHCEGSIMALDYQKSTTAKAKSYSRKISASRWYEIMARVGLTYGQSFQGIEFLEASPTEPVAIADVTRTVEGSYLFHPASMDSALQLVIAARAKAASRNLTQLVVPTFIAEIEVFAMSDRMTAKAWASPDGKDIALLCTAGDRVTLRVKGVRLTTLDNDQEPGMDRHRAARMEFFPDIDFMSASSLIVPPTVQRKTRVIIEEIALLSILDSAERVEHLEPSQLHYEKYRKWLYRARERAIDGAYSLFQVEAHSFTALNQKQRLYEIEKRLAELTQDPTCNDMAHGMYKLNHNCEALFTGKMDALPILMEDNILARIHDSISFDFSKYIRLLCINKPTLRILEVGAGTGSATELILQGLISTSKNPAYNVYTFTDISAGFFTQASERFKHAPNMEYKLFDISQCPFNQGFQAGSYDLIVANNVIHATETLQVTLGNLRKLLRLGGQMLLSEICSTAVHAFSYVFGQFSGWWMGEADNRKWEPFVSVDRWDCELKAAGFTGVDSVVFDEDEPYRCMAAMISRSTSLTPNRPQITAGVDAVTVLCDKPDEGPSASLIAALRSRRYNVIVTKFGNLPLLPDRPIIVTLDLEGNFYQDITADRLSAFQELCRQHQGQKLLWLMPPVQIDSVNPRVGQTLGALRIIRAELDLPFHTLELSQSEPSFTDLTLKVLQKIVLQDENEALAPEREFVVESGIVKIGRCQPFSLEQDTASSAASEPDVKRLRIGRPGLLDTLQWVGIGHSPLMADEVEIETKAVGLNFRDIMVSMGILTFGDGPPQFGVEMSGIVNKVGSAVHHVGAGDRVIALAKEGCFSTRTVMKASLVVKIPENLGFEDAATMPAVFGTAIQALMRVAHLEKGKSVLVHSACGGVGHAAVQLCRNFGAEIYVTVGSGNKVEYCHRVLGIPKNRIFNSRDDSFVVGVMRETDDRGVDIVLNSLSGKLLHASWGCVAEFGQLIELGKRDLVGFGSLDLEPFLLNRSYCCIDLVHLLERRPQYVGCLLQETIEMFCDGKIKPIPSCAEFSAQEIEQAFRYLQKGDHIGKAIVKMPENPSDLAARKRPDINFDPSASYLLTGGLGGIGRSVASWMAECGVRSLVFLSRSAGRGQDDGSFFAELATLGCIAVPVPGQAQIVADVERAIASAPNPIKGVIHLAMVLQDGRAVDLTFAEWTAATAPKVEGAWNLHNAFIERGQTLDFFLVSSSFTTLVEQPGQSNYAAANTFLEALVQYRRRLGLSAAVIGLCAVEDVGFVADSPIIRRKLKAQGVHFLPEREMLEFFQHALANQQDQKQHGVPQDHCSHWANKGYTIAGLHSEVHLDDPDCPTAWRKNRKMGMYHNLRAKSLIAGSKSSSGLKAFLEQAAASSDPPRFLLEDAGVDYLATEIGTRIFQLMMRDAADMDISMSVSAIGLDSLIAVELRKWWKQSFAVDVTVLEMMGAGSLRQLGRLAGEAVKKRIVESG